MNDEEAKDLPSEEFKDFFSIYDQDIGQSNDGKYLSFEDALKQPFDINEGIHTFYLYSASFKPVVKI